MLLLITACINREEDLRKRWWQFWTSVDHISFVFIFSKMKHYSKWKIQNNYLKPCFNVMVKKNTHSLRLPSGRRQTSWLLIKCGEFDVVITEHKSFHRFDWRVNDWAIIYTSFSRNIFALVCRGYICKISWWEDTRKFLNIVSVCYWYASKIILYASLKC